MYSKPNNKYSFWNSPNFLIPIFDPNPWSYGYSKIISLKLCWGIPISIKIVNSLSGIYDFRNKWLVVSQYFIFFLVNDSKSASSNDHCISLYPPLSVLEANPNSKVLYLKFKYQAEKK